MQRFTFLVSVICMVTAMSTVSEAQRFYNRCLLANKLYKHGVQNLAAWVCLAEVHTNGRFDSLHKEGNGYGLWEISSKKWCRDDLYKAASTSRCNLDCDRFWDGDLSDDVRCLTQMFVERGFPEFRGWTVRHSTCPNLKTYLNGCGVPANGLTTTLQ